MFCTYPYFDLWHRYARWLHASLAAMLSLSMCLASPNHEHAAPTKSQHKSTPIENTRAPSPQRSQPTPTQALQPCEPETWLDQAVDLHLRWQRWAYKGRDQKAGIAEVTGRWEDCMQWLDALTTHQMQLDHVTLKRDHNSKVSRTLHLSCRWHCIQHHAPNEVTDA